MFDAQDLLLCRTLARPQRCGIVPTLGFWTTGASDRLSLPLLLPQVFLAAPLALVALGLGVSLALPLLLGVALPLALMGLCERELRRALARHRVALAAAWRAAPEGRPPPQPRVVVRLRGAVHSPPRAPARSRAPAPALATGALIAWLFEPVLPDLWLGGLRALLGACGLLLVTAWLGAGAAEAHVAVTLAALLPGAVQLAALRRIRTGPFPAPPPPEPPGPRTPAPLAPHPGPARAGARARRAVFAWTRARRTRDRRDDPTRDPEDSS